MVVLHRVVERDYDSNNKTLLLLNLLLLAALMASRHLMASNANAINNVFEGRTVSVMRLPFALTVNFWIIFALSL